MFIGFTYMFIPLGLALELIEDREVRSTFGFFLFFNVSLFHEDKLFVSL